MCTIGIRELKAHRSQTLPEGTALELLARVRGDRWRVVLDAEPGAVLPWLLGESRGAKVGQLLETATPVVTSELTTIECARALHRARVSGMLSGSRGERLRLEYLAFAARWDRLAITDRVAAVASGAFPVEPVRALDAMHLAGALLARRA